ncbi:prestin-like [Saccostrea echinata]|uniref:prestin-like n=1 Tax=Saccostrea echinata TaxID=191078 RepID=UPI002A836BA5|nr:prestin-like [Saccostrea echinata]
MTSVEFRHRYVEIEENNNPLMKRVKQNVYCSYRRVWKFWAYHLPILKFIKYYKLKEYLFSDILTGLTIGIMHIPQALAFGMLTSVKVENGLYTSLWPILFYVIFGTSPHISMGTSAVICMVTAGVVDMQAEVFKSNNQHLFHAHLANANGTMQNATTIEWTDIPEFMDFKENVAMNIALFSGLILIFMGMFRLGFITFYFSVSFFSGFTSGAAVHIATSQMPALLGIAVKRYSGPFKIVYTYRDIFLAITTVKVATILISIICIVILLAVKELNERFKHKLKAPIPIELIVVIIATIASYVSKFDENYDVAVVGAIPNTIPAPVLPDITGVQYYLGDCFVVAILIFSNTIAMAKICAKKHNYELNDNQEIYAYGICNFASSFFKCFPSAVAPPRSMILSSMNARTTISGLFSALLMLLVILAISELFFFLPKAALASIILVALKGLFVQMTDARRFWKINKYDFIIWLCTITSVVFIDIDFGLGIGLAISLLTVVFQSQRASAMRLMKYNPNFRTVRSIQKLYSLSPVKIFVYKSNIFFANAEMFRSKLYSATVNPRKFVKLLNKKKEIDANKKDTEKITQNGANATKKISTISTESGLSNASPVFTSLSLEDSISSPNVESFASQLDNVEANPIHLDSAYVCLPPPSHVLSLGSIDTIQSLETIDSGFDEISHPKQLLSEYMRTRVIILEMACVNYIDASGCNLIVHIHKEYSKLGIRLLLAGISEDVSKTLKHSGAFDAIPKDDLYPDLTDAIVSADEYVLQPSKADLSPTSHSVSFTDEEAAEESYVVHL